VYSGGISNANGKQGARGTLPREHGGGVHARRAEKNIKSEAMRETGAWQILKKECGRKKSPRQWERRCNDDVKKNKNRRCMTCHRQTKTIYASDNSHNNKVRGSLRSGGNAGAVALKRRQDTIRGNHQNTEGPYKKGE